MLIKRVLYILLATAVIAFSGCQKDDNHDIILPEDMFHFLAIEDGLEVSMKLHRQNEPHPAVPSLLYSINGKSWKKFIPDVTTVRASRAGDKIYIKADNMNSTFASRIEGSGVNGYFFHISAKANVCGNIMYLLNGSTPESANMGEAAFGGLFCTCEDKLIDASKLILPALKLTPFCYYSTFFTCSKLIAAPELPATELAECCYSNMFNNCSSLTKAPDLPAVKLAYYCYFNLFYYCEKLRIAPSLPASKMTEGCYCSMFYHTAIETAPQLISTELADWCYYSMFSSCYSLSEAPVLPASKLNDFCYTFMFCSCTSLTKATVLAQDISPTGCVTGMFYGITTNGTLKASLGVDWAGVKPNGWSVVYE